MTAVDNIARDRSIPLVAPYTHLAAITPHDTNELGYVTRAIYVGADGNITLVAQDDSATVTLIGVKAGSVLDIRAKKVTTATTAQNLVALW